MQHAYLAGGDATHPLRAQSRGARSSDPLSLRTHTRFHAASSLRCHQTNYVSPKGHLQSFHCDIAPSTAFLTSELRAIVADTTRARDSRLNASLSSRCDHASKPPLTLWTHGRSLPKRTTFAEHLATLVQPPVDKLPQRELISNDSHYALKHLRREVLLVTTLAELDEYTHRLQSHSSTTLHLLGESTSAHLLHTS